MSGRERERDMDLRRALASVLNRFSKENGSDTPDFILATYLDDCLRAWDLATRMRDEWYGHKPWSRLNDDDLAYVVAPTTEEGER